MSTVLKQQTFKNKLTTGDEILLYLCKFGLGSGLPGRSFTHVFSLLSFLQSEVSLLNCSPFPLCKPTKKTQQKHENITTNAATGCGCTVKNDTLMLLWLAHDSATAWGLQKEIRKWC